VTIPPASSSPASPASLPADLDSRAAVHDLVVEFYREVVFDDLLEPVFGEVAEVDWARHIPHLVDYWCRVLLGEPGYEGAILRAHAHVHSIEPLRIEHFDRWYALWEACVDRRWEGPVAERAKGHARRIGGVLSSRLLGVGWQPTPAGVSAPHAGTVSPA
jgi:hemoglobin